MKPEGFSAPKQGRFKRLYCPWLAQAEEQPLGFGGCHFEVEHGSGNITSKGKDLWWLPRTGIATLSSDAQDLF